MDGRSVNALSLAQLAILFLTIRGEHSTVTMLLTAKSATYVPTTIVPNELTLSVLLVQFELASYYGSCLNNSFRP